MEKKRGLIESSKDVSENFILDKIQNDESLHKYISNKKIKKKIFIPNKIMNIII